MEQKQWIDLNNKVVIVTGVSMKFTNTSIFENSSEYTHTIIFLNEIPK